MVDGNEEKLRFPREFAQPRRNGQVIAELIGKQPFRNQERKKKKEILVGKILKGYSSQLPQMPLRTSNGSLPWLFVACFINPSAEVNWKMLIPFM